MKVELAEILEGKHPNFQTGKLKNKLIKEGIFKYECSICKISEWQGSHIVLQLDHIDGNSKNHLKDNLRLLCPNCHSQTSTYAGKNKKASVKVKVDDADVLVALKNSESILSAIKSLGLSNGGNYTRFVKIAKDNKLNNLLVDVKGSFLTDEIHTKLKELDYSKFGWVGKASKIIGLPPQKTRKWIEKHCPELLNDAFKRN